MKIEMSRWIAIAMTSCAALAACGDGGVRVSSTSAETSDDKGALKVVSSLQCPQTLGVLTRKGSASAGGSICSYVGERGAEVSLHLVALNGTSPQTVLQAFQDRLSAAMPEASSRIGNATSTASAAAPGRTAEKRSDMSMEAKGDKARIRLPGLEIEADGDKARVNIGGLRIRADDASGAVSVDNAGGDQVRVDANQAAVQVQTSASAGATRATWILTDERAAGDAWRFVGYEARGPVGGPLVVATVRSKDGGGGRTLEDAGKLVILNVGR